MWNVYVKTTYNNNRAYTKALRYFAKDYCTNNELQCIFRPHKMAERSHKSLKNSASIPIEVIFLYSGYGLDHRILYRIECHRQTNTANILFIKTRIYLKMDLVQFCALLLFCIIFTHVNQYHQVLRVYLHSLHGYIIYSTVYCTLFATLVGTPHLNHQW